MVSKNLPPSAARSGDAAPDGVARGHGVPGSSSPPTPNRDSQARAINAQGPIPVSATILLGRTKGLVDVVLPHPTVSQRHAKIYRRGPNVMVVDLRSTYGTFVEGKRIVREVPIGRGSRLGIGAYQFLFDGTNLVPDVTAAAELSLACLGVTRVVSDRVTGQPLTLLHDVSLAIKPRELVCLIGPSGSGKSTLLSLLCGRVQPDRGRVVYGGRDLHAEFESLKHDLAVVPQREALHQLLTVRQSLWYSAGLRLPSDTTSSELEEIVAERLQEVGLAARREVRIRDLSGGQLKRISLANEIPHRPSLVFLDEVTSGLDELGDEDMMRLFRDLADKGRSVVCITHNTLNIERNAHLVVVLTAGGRLACVGSPSEVCRYFGISRLGDVYYELSKKQPQEWEARFRSHALKTQYIDSRLPRGGMSAVATAAAGFKVVSPRRPIRLTRQLRLLAARVFALQVMDVRGLGMAIGQAVFVGAMLVALFGDVQNAEDAFADLMNGRNAVFLLLVSIFWLGCNNAAPEIVKERLLFERERAVSVNAETYYVAKLFVLGGVSLAQALIVYALLYAFCNLPGSAESGGFVTQLTTVLMVGALGTFMGLAISAQAKSEEMAVRTVPIVLIPQIVLANVIATLDGWLEWVAMILVSTYWSFQAFTSGVESYVKPDEDPTTFFPAALVLGLHYAFLIVMALLGLRSAAGGSAR
jgi:ABC-type multidrug transport system ATPase subunit